MDALRRLSLAVRERWGRLSPRGSVRYPFGCRKTLVRVDYHMRYIALSYLSLLQGRGGCMESKVGRRRDSSIFAGTLHQVMVRDQGPLKIDRKYWVSS